MNCLGHISQSSGSVRRSKEALKWVFGLATVFSLVVALSAAWAQMPDSTSEDHSFFLTQQFNTPTMAGDLRLDQKSLAGNHIPTVWEAAEERKTERDGKQREVNSSHSYTIETPYSLHERKSQFAQQRQESETPGISLVVLHHAWKGYLS
jgi:hypothetical protein